ncbi:MAG TPA: DUF5522 domain-containing protein [Acidimicrobiales bacterium]|nr:DUF5522 domain-containing protein [Acidimicrobiales bacterium]
MRGDAGGSGRRSDPVASRPPDEPHPDRLSPAHPDYEAILDLHAEALRRGAMSYTDPGSGYTVLTAGYLIQRGYCCESGCRHCPYLE